MSFDPNLYRRAQFAKHLVGRHDQKTHGRDEHRGKDAAKTAAGAAIGGGLMELLGRGANMPKGAMGALGALAGGLFMDQVGGLQLESDKQGKNLDQQNAYVRDKTVQWQVDQGRLPKGTTGDAMADAMKFGNMSEGEYHDDYAKWSKEKYGEVVGGTSEMAEYNVDRGIWPDKLMSGRDDWDEYNSKVNEFREEAKEKFG